MSDLPPQKLTALEEINGSTHVAKMFEVHVHEVRVFKVQYCKWSDTYNTNIRSAFYSINFLHHICDYQVLIPSINKNSGLYDSRYITSPKYTSLYAT